MAPRGCHAYFRRQLAPLLLLCMECGRVGESRLRQPKAGWGDGDGRETHRDAVALVAALAVAVPAPAVASGPKLTVPEADLQAAFNCPIDPTNATRTPLMFVTGTGATGDEGDLIGRAAFEAYGHPVCYVNFPDFTTADIQVSVQYLVYGLRREFKMADRRIAVFGISQGGLLPRFALTYWPDLRRKVSDVLSAAGTHHGTRGFRKLLRH